GDQPYGLPNSGIEDAVRRLTPDSLRDWHRQWVRSGNVTIAVVGDIDTAELRDLLADAVPTGGPVSIEAATTEPLPPREQVDACDRRQTASAMGFAGADV